MPGLMEGKRGLIMGVANDHSIAWGIAKTLAAHGAELAFTYQGEALGKRVKPLAQSVGAKLIMPCDVEDVSTVDAVFEDIKHLVAGAVGRELLQTGDLDKGIFWAGMVQGLIHDIPTVKELIDRIIGEAEQIVKARIGGMLA